LRGFNSFLMRSFSSRFSSSLQHMTRRWQQVDREMRQVRSAWGAGGGGCAATHWPRTSGCCPFSGGLPGRHETACCPTTWVHKIGVQAVSWPRGVGNRAIWSQQSCSDAGWVAGRGAFCVLLTGSTVEQSQRLCEIDEGRNTSKYRF
jgi:hypothetical protein